MSHVIQRSADDADDLYVWWDGATLGAGAQVVVGADEVAAFFHGTQVLALIGPGRTTPTSASHPALAPYLERHLFSAQPELSICFITTRAWAGWEIETEVGRVAGPDGVMSEMSCWASLTLKLSPPETFAGQLLQAEAAAASASEAADVDSEEVDDTVDESEEEEGEEGEEEDDDAGGPNPVDYFLEQAARTAVAKVLVESKPALSEMTGMLAERLPALITAELSWLGVQVVGVGELELYRDDELVG